MIEPVMQEWFYREIQRAFREGVSYDVLLGILSRFLAVALLIIAIFAVWRHWVLISFHLRRIWNSRRQAGIRNKIAGFLHQRRIVIGVYLVGVKTRQFLGTAVLTRFKGGRLVLQMTSDVPATLKRVLPGRRIICFAKPFRVGGKRVNSFSTYVLDSKVADGQIRTIQAYVPDEFTAIPRRRHVRLRIRRSGGIRIKLWGEGKKSRFLLTAPDFETREDVGETMSWKAMVEPLDISPAGMKIQVRPQRGSPALRVLEDVMLELQILDPAQKVFQSFLLNATVRNIKRPGGGLMEVGLEFRALGERVASRSVTWSLIGEDVEPLHALLESMRGPKRASRRVMRSKS